MITLELLPDPTLTRMERFERLRKARRDAYEQDPEKYEEMQLDAQLYPGE